MRDLIPGCNGRRRELDEVECEHDKEGLETIIELKKGNPDLPIIAMSGGGHMSSDDILELALSLGANAVLRKPFDGSELIALVESCLAPISDS